MSTVEVTVLGSAAEAAAEGAPTWVWIALTLTTCLAFWSQATVTEERLVPALNVIADYFNIPDDIAGATLMAAGASSPELFSSIVALFVTHSSLGLGTIVGSEIFNQLIICAGAVYASSGGSLQLDRIIVAREVGFYALSIALLFYALRDSEPDPDDPDGPEHIFISFTDSVVVFSGYLLYVLVCANMEAIKKLFKKGHDDESESTSLVNQDESVEYGAVGDIGRTKRVTVMSLRHVPKLPFLHNVTDEPVENFSEKVEMHFSKRADADEGKFGYQRENNSSISDSIRSSMAKSSLLNYVKHEDRPTDLHDVYGTKYNEYTQELECFLWQRSLFYSKAFFGSHAWHLRYFTIKLNGISSVPDRFDPDQHKMTYPKFEEIFIDEKRQLIHIVNPVEKKRDFTLMAPSAKIFTEVVSAFDKFMETNAVAPPSASMDEDSCLEGEGFLDADEHVGLIEFPVDGSNLEIIMFFCLYPLRILMHYTVPDVRHLDEHGEASTGVGLAFFSSFMCLVWLIVGSYAMVASLEALAELLDVPDAVVGFTVSAAGTSLPNYVASSVAARNGFGNQAVSNAFGSNTFNILVGLGLPWMMYTSFGTGFEPYHALRNENIVQSILILAGVLLLFVVLMLQSGFVIYRWHGHLFLVLYAAFIAFSIGGVYLGNNPSS